MEIIKPGDNNTGYLGRWNCHRCGCEWRMTEADPIPKKSEHQIDGTYFFMPCPHCREHCIKPVGRSSQWDR